MTFDDYLKFKLYDAFIGLGLVGLILLVGSIVALVHATKERRDRDRALREIAEEKSDV